MVKDKVTSKQNGIGSSPILLATADSSVGRASAQRDLFCLFLDYLTKLPIVKDTATSLFGYNPKLETLYLFVLRQSNH
jgi:hypothetical protein